MPNNLLSNAFWSPKTVFAFWHLFVQTKEKGLGTEKGVDKSKNGSKIDRGVV